MHNYLFDSFYSYFQGALLTQFLLFFFVYILFRRKEFFFYSFYLLSLAIYYFINTPGILLGMPGNGPLFKFLQTYFGPPIVMLFNLLYVLFISTFLELKKYKNIYRLVKALLHMSWVALLIFLLVLATNKSVSVILNIVNLVGLSATCVLAIMIFVKKIPYGKYVATGMLIYLAGSIGTVILLFSLKTNPNSIFSHHHLFFVKVGLFADMVLYFIVIIKKWIDTEKQTVTLAAEKIREIEKERLRIAADLHDDMGAGISRIRFLGEQVKNKLPDDSIKNDINSMIGLSDDLVDKMNEIIWTLNSSDERLQEVVYYIRGQCSQLVDNAGLAFTCSLPDDLANFVFSASQKRNLYLAIMEAVHNAVKHAKASTIDLGVKTTGSQLNIVISDNGTGFDIAENSAKGNGLSNYQKRMNSLKGKVLLQSGSNGTRVEFEVPLQ